MVQAAWRRGRTCNRCEIWCRRIGSQDSHRHQGFILQTYTMLCYFCHFCCYKPVSQSCTVAKSEQFWQVSGQSNLADRKEDCSNGESAVVWVRKLNLGSFCCSQPFVCQVWLCCGLPEFLTFSYWAWLWNWCFVLLLVYTSSASRVMSPNGLWIFNKYTVVP